MTVSYNPHQILLDSFNLSHVPMNPVKHLGSDGNYHYIYLVVNMLNGKYYIGKRTGKINHNLDLYLGSGIGIRNAVNYYGRDSFLKFYLHFDETSDLAFKKESEILTKEWLKGKRNECYNQQLGGDGWNTGNRSIYRPKDSPINTKGIMLESNDPLVISGEYISSHIGKKSSKETREKYSKNHKNKTIIFDPILNKNREIDINHPDYISNKYISAYSGKVNVWDETRQRQFRISVYHPDYVSGKFINANLGRKQLYNKFGKRFDIIDVNDPKIITENLKTYDEWKELGITIKTGHSKEEIKEHQETQLRITNGSYKFKDSQRTYAWKLKENSSDEYDYKNISISSISEVRKLGWLVDENLIINKDDGYKNYYTKSGTIIKLLPNHPGVLLGEFRTSNDWKKVGVSIKNLLKLKHSLKSSSSPKL